MTKEPRQARARKRALAGFALVMASRGVGLALFPILLVEAPVVLVLLSPILAHLVLTGTLLAPWLYFTAALGASIVQSVVAYHFGQVLGARAQLWLEGRGAATHAATERISRWMEWSAPVVLIAMAGPPVCAIAGAARVRPRVFYPAMLVAQLAWVGACFVFGVAVTEQLARVRVFIAAHLIELSILALAWVGGGYLWKRWRRARVAERELS